MLIDKVCGRGFWVMLASRAEVGEQARSFDENRTTTGLA